MQLTICESDQRNSRNRLRSQTLGILVLSALVIAAAGCTSSSSDFEESSTSSEPEKQSQAKTSVPASSDTYELVRIVKSNLPNAIKLNDKVISGGQPEGAMGFAQLKELGINTIISVDGAAPDLESAAKHGMQYVHLPHGYNGVSSERAVELAKCVRQFPGPIYIHCHHGKHRSPTAAAVASIGAGLMPANAGLAVLKEAGTNKNYQGLFNAAESAKRFEVELLEQLDCEFPATAKLPPMAESMVQLEHTMDHIKTIADSDWRSPADHPDLSPAHESLILLEHFKEMLRDHHGQNPEPDFVAYASQSAAAAKDIHNLLDDLSVDGIDSPLNQQQSEILRGSLQLIEKNCKACHKQFRDIPLVEN